MKKIDIREGTVVGIFCGIICFLFSFVLQSYTYGIICSMTFLLGWIVCSIVKDTW